MLRFARHTLALLLACALPALALADNGKPLRIGITLHTYCLLYTSPSPRDKRQSRMPSSA